MPTKQSFGGGYGINRKTGGASSLPTAVPAYGHVTRNPGKASDKATGRTGKSHFAGAKIDRRTA